MSTRLFVAGVQSPHPLPGLEVLNFWMRFPVTLPARQAFYAIVQGNATPQAPGAYTGADAAELTAYRAGQFIERQGYDVIDTTTGQSITDRLARLYNLALPAITSTDNTSLQFYGTSTVDGENWIVKSA